MNARSTRSSSRATRGRRRQRVVGLELDHRPHRDAERRERVLEQRELREQLGVHALARLVAEPEVVAERLDDVVGGHADVRRPLLEHPEHRAEHAAHRGDLDAVGSRCDGTAKWWRNSS